MKSFSSIFHFPALCPVVFSGVESGKICGKSTSLSSFPVRKPSQSRCLPRLRPPIPHPWLQKILHCPPPPPSPSTDLPSHQYPSRGEPKHQEPNHHLSLQPPLPRHHSTRSEPKHHLSSRPPLSGAYNTAQPSILGPPPLGVTKQPLRHRTRPSYCPWQGHRSQKKKTQAYNSSSLPPSSDRDPAIRSKKSTLPTNSMFIGDIFITIPTPMAQKFEDHQSRGPGLPSMSDFMKIASPLPSSAGRRHAPVRLSSSHSHRQSAMDASSPSMAAVPPTTNSSPDWPSLQESMVLSPPTTTTTSHRRRMNSGLSHNPCSSLPLHQSASLAALNSAI